MTQPEPDTEQAVEEPPNNREAQKYRLRLREAEAERDRLREQLVSNQRHQIDTMISAAGIKPRAVWSLGHEPGDLLDDDGIIPDPTKIRAAVVEARAELGVGVDTSGLRRGLESGAGNRREPVDTWTSAFAPKDQA